MTRLIFTIAFSILFFAPSALAQCPDDIEASFDIEGNTRFCEGKSVLFLNRSNPDDGTMRYVWYWGDGTKNDTTNTKINVNHTFNINTSCTTTSRLSENYTVTLKMYRPTDTTCTHKTSKDLFISRKYKLSFSALPNPVCLDNPLVNFTSAACPVAANVFWQFGDSNSGINNTSILPNPAHRFSSAGTFNVTLTVASAICGNESITQPVTIADSATAEAIYSVPQPTCAGRTVVFTNQSKNSTGSTWVITGGSNWNFVNGTGPSSRDISVLFFKAGTYTVTLNTRNACGTDKVWRSQSIVISDIPSVKIAPITTPVCQSQPFKPSLQAFNGGGLATTYEWFFENGTPASSVGSAAPSVMFSASGWVKIVAKNDCGISKDSVFLTVNPQGNAAAAFTGYPTTGCAPFTLTLKNNSVGANAYSWSVVRADGSPLRSSDTVLIRSETMREPFIDFKTAGQFRIVLNITNTCAGGNLTWTSDIINVTAKPKATLMPVLPKCIPADITFDARADLGNDPLSKLTFSVNNETRSTFDNLTFRFNTIGDYLAIATVSNVCGNAFDQQVVRILQPAQLAGVGFQNLPTKLCAPFSVKMKNASLGATFYKWTVRNLDNTVGGFLLSNSGVSEPQIEFLKRGRYQIILEIGNACGTNPVWTSEILTVLEPPKVQFSAIMPRCGSSITFNPTADLGGDPLSIKYFSIDINGVPTTFSTFDGLVIPFTTAGSYLAIAKVTNVCGVDSVTQTIQILPKGKADAKVEGIPTNGCGPFTVTLKNTSEGDATNMWKVVRADRSPLLSTDIVAPTNGTTWTSKNPQIKFSTAGQFRIQLLITNTCGGDLAWESDVIDVKTAPKITLDSIPTDCRLFKDLKIKVDSGAAPLSIFTVSIDSSGTIILTRSGYNPTVLLNSSGTYTAFVKAANVCGEATAQRIIQIKQPAKVEASIPNLPTKLCVPLIISTKNNSIGVTSTTWTVKNLDNTISGFQFKNGTNANSNEPQFEFLKHGRYILNLEIGNACGANVHWISDTLTVFDVPTLVLDSITPFCPPKSLLLKPTVDSGSTSLSNYTVSIDSSGTIITRSGYNPTFFFNTSGTYMPTVKATNICGEATAQGIIQIKQPAKVDASILNLPAKLCAPFVISTKNNSVGATFYKWTVKNLDNTVDGFLLPNPISAEPQIEFLKRGRYIVMLEIGNACGANLIWTSDTLTVLEKPKILAFDPIVPVCEQNSVTLNIRSDAGNDPLSIKRVSVDTIGGVRLFSTFNNLIIPFPSAGNFKIIATITNVCGSDTAQQIARILPKGQAAATVSGYTDNHCAPFVLTLNDTSVGGATRLYKVVRADGSALQSTDTVRLKNDTTWTTKSPQIEFVTVGEYLIKLLITNPCGGNLEWKSDTIFVRKAPKLGFDTITPLCPPAIVVLKTKADSGGLPLSIHTISVHLKDTILTFLGPNASVNITTVGSFLAIARAKNLCGSDSIQRVIEIKQPAEIATNIQSQPTKLCAPALIVLKDSSKGATFHRYRIKNLDNTTAGFQFKNGTDSTSANPQIEFLKHGRYVIIHEIGNACGVNKMWSSDTLTVFEAPSALIDSLKTTDCAVFPLNPIANFKNGGDTLGIKWTADSGTIVNPMNPIPGLVTFANAGVFKLTVSITNRCGTAMDEKTITVVARQNPQIALVRDTFCTADPKITLPTSPSGGRTRINDSLVSSNFQFDPSLYLGAVRINYTVGEGRCADSTMRTVHVFGTKVNAGPDINTCDTLSFQLYGATPIGGKYDTTGQNFITPTGLIITPLAGVGRHVVTYSFKESVAGCVNKATRIITINQRPKAKIAVDSFGCKGLSVNLTGLLSIYSDSFKWNFGDSTTANGATVSHVYARAGIYTIQLITSTGEGCSDTLTQQITINAPPKVLATVSDTLICPRDTVDFQNRNIELKTTYVWRNEQGLDTMVANLGRVLFINNTIRDTTIKTTMTATVRGCPSKDTIISVKVFGKTKATFLQSLDTICAGQTVNFAPFVFNAVYYKWIFDNGYISNALNPPTQRFLGDTIMRIYTVRFIAIGLCNSDTVTRQIVVRPSKLKAFVDIADSVVCFKTPILLRTRTNDGATTTYRFDDGTTATGDSIWHQFAHVGRNTFTIFITNGCEIDSSVRTVTLLEVPSVKFTFSTPDPCKGNLIQFKNGTTGGGVSGWSYGNGARSTLVNPLYTYPNAGNFMVKLTAINPITGCIATDSALVAAYLPLSSPVVVALPTRCFADLGSMFVNLDSSKSGKPPFLYALNDSAFSNKTGIFTNLASPKTYIVRVKDANGCTSETTVTLTSPPPFSVDAGGTRSVNLGDSIVVLAVANRRSGVQFQWKNLSINTKILPTDYINCLKCPETWLRPFVNTVFQVTAKDTAGCMATATLAVEVNRTAHVFIPNAFSPNFDGINDVLYPFSDLSVRQIKRLEIFNRWGSSLFRKTNFATGVEAHGWNGQNAENGVYLFVLEIEFLDGTEMLLSEDVTLMR
jgi:PKD repeat protein